jgi:hypothetical protein
VRFNKTTHDEGARAMTMTRMPNLVSLMMWKMTLIYYQNTPASSGANNELEQNSCINLTAGSTSNKQQATKKETDIKNLILT